MDGGPTRTVTRDELEQFFDECHAYWDAVPGNKSVLHDWRIMKMTNMCPRVLFDRHVNEALDCYIMIDGRVGTKREYLAESALWINVVKIMRSELEKWQAVKLELQQG